VKEWNALADARERLRHTIEEYVRLDGQLRALENTSFRVCIFGSARIRPADPIYHQVFHLAQLLSERGIDVVTGGGPGLMEAANRGVSAARRRKSTSYGLLIDLPTLSEKPNGHLDVQRAHQRFSSRLDEFIRLSHAVVVAPGGVGTLLELCYVWQLLQLDAAEPRPVLLLGRSYWQGLLHWLQQVPAAGGLIGHDDLSRLTLVNSVQETLLVLESYHGKFLLERPEPQLPEPPEVTELLLTNLEEETASLDEAIHAVRLAA